MTRYAARAIPWTRVVLAAGLVCLLVELVRWNPWVLWPLEGTAVGLLAGATAWCFDEPAAAVVDPAPRGLAWRTTARSVGPLLLLAAWSAVVLHAGNATFFGHRDTIWLQGFAAAVVAAAYSCWRRTEGEPVPGGRFAAATVAVATGWALIRPFDHRFTVFPYATTTPGGWQASSVGWALAAAMALGVLAAALADVSWRRRWPRRLARA